jgi:hypothetical protein
VVVVLSDDPPELPEPPELPPLVPPELPEPPPLVPPEPPEPPPPEFEFVMTVLTTAVAMLCAAV